jgi:hypothetical protein
MATHANQTKEECAILTIHCALFALQEIGVKVERFPEFLLITYSKGPFSVEIEIGISRNPYLFCTRVRAVQDDNGKLSDYLLRNFGMGMSIGKYQGRTISVASVEDEFPSTHMLKLIDFVKSQC